MQHTPAKFKLCEQTHCNDIFKSIIHWCLIIQIWRCATMRTFCFCNFVVSLKNKARVERGQHVRIIKYISIDARKPLHILIHGVVVVVFVVFVVAHKPIKFRYSLPSTWTLLEDLHVVVGGRCIYIWENGLLAWLPCRNRKRGHHCSNTYINGICQTIHFSS